MAIGEIFLAAFLQVLFEKFSSPALSQFVKLAGRGKIRKTIEQWEGQLRKIEAVLAVAEQQQLVNTAIKPWLQEFQDLAYDMEDILDHFAIQVQAHAYNMNNASAPGVFGSAKKMVKRLSVMLNPISRVKNQAKIDNITDRLHNIQTQIQGLNLTMPHIIQQQTLQIEAFRQKRETTSLVPMVFGRDEKKNEIITQLLKDDQSKENYVVIPIVGKGGIGKTTLAQYVYNDEQQLKGCFDLKAWVCVSDVYDVKRITTTIIKAVPPGTVGDLSSLNEAQEKLKQALMGKKFLIVLDDIWNDNYDDWDLLRKPFLHAAKGSRVIMTTRNEKVATTMMVNNPINSINKLDGLSGDDCWRIFQQHANEDTDLSEMQNDIIHRCKGLPLAAKTLAGLLKKTERRQRREVLESNIWSRDSEHSHVLPVLRLSYHHLPAHLKLIFAYCAVFPKDYIFEEMEVVLLWVAQGFLPENQTKRMEDIGHDYFCELVSRSLFEASQSSKEGFIMHDLIHDLALWAAGNICYVTSTGDTPHRYLNRIRHVSLTMDATQLGNQLPMASQWRTFYCPSNDESIEDLCFIQRFRYMRALILTSDKINVLPECIGDLKHLRYLVLNFERLEELPKSINNLWNLQTLELCCSSLQHVPNIGLLGKLRHLVIDTTSLREMPMGIGKLSNLQILNEFVLGDGYGERIRDLKNLNHLHGELRISGLKSVLSVEDAKEAQLDKKDGLDELCLEWSRGRDAAGDISKKDVVEQLKPHNFIKKLELDGYRGLRFPTWLENPCFIKMVDIRLKECEKCEYLPPLGQLPLLRNLSIDGMHGIKEIGAEFYGDLRCQTSSFPVLENMTFLRMGSWEKWVHSPAHDCGFPRLKELSIGDCRSLEGELPPHLPFLTKLSIVGCKELSLSLQSLPLLEVLSSRKCDIVFTNYGGCCSDVGADECLNIPCELAYLTTLEISDCHSPISLPEGLLLPALQHLVLEGCQNVESLPSELHKYTSLRTLTIERCPQIKEIPEGGLPINLENLTIEQVNIKQRVQELAVHHLHSLRFLKLILLGMTPEDLFLPSSLSELFIWDSQNLKTISSCTTHPNLTKLWVHDCPMFESLVGKFTSLSHVRIQNCPNFEFSAGGGLPRNLTRLELEGRMNRDKPIREWGLHLLSSLVVLELRDMGRSTTQAVECIPSPNLQLPYSSLRYLEVSGFQNLESISCSTYPNMLNMKICGCPKFQSFGDHGLPPKLQYVYIEECELLKPHLKIDPDGPIDLDGCSYSLL